MRDLSDEHDYYRSAVNLELTQQKVKDYGNMKGRVQKQETTAAPSAKLRH
jgi:hypothetical protein